MLLLVYKSTETEPFTDTALKRLLVGSRLRNSQAGVTGMLIYDHGAFLQALEGDAAAVQATFARIEQDPRHRDIVVLLRDNRVQSRAYGAWSMGYADSSGLATLLKGFIDLPHGLRTPALDRVNAMKLLDAAASHAA